MFSNLNLKNIRFISGRNSSQNKRNLSRKQEEFSSRTGPHQSRKKSVPLVEEIQSRTRVADPDPYWIRIQSGQWNRIRIQEGKNDPQK
jgi:hypothetical protein